MGNSECGFSNATNFNVKFALHSDKKTIIKSDIDVGGGINVGIPKVKAGVEGHYKSKAEAKHYLVDPNFEGFSYDCEQRGEA